MAESVFMRVLLLIIAIAGIIHLASLPQQIFADTACQPIYGGGQSCVSSNVSIEKDVVNPATNTDVHDLGQNDPLFHGGDTVIFHITIRNTGSNQMGGATVTDTFPQYLTFASGPGTFDPGTGSLSFQIGPLAPNQSATYTVMGKVVDASQLPSVQPNCVVNEAVVVTNDQQSAQDSSQFCLAAPSVSVSSVAPPQVIQTPATGASSIATLLLLPLGITGYVVQRFAKRRKGHET